MIEYIPLHIAAIQTIGRTIVEFDDNNVFALVPANLDTAQLPALYSLTGSATYNESTMGEWFEEVTRIYRIQVPVVPIGQANPETRESLCRPLIEKTAYTFNQYPTLGNCQGVRANGVRVLSDSGIVVLPEWGAKFVGFEIRLQVVYDVPREFAPGE